MKPTREAACPAPRRCRRNDSNFLESTNLSPPKARTANSARKWRSDIAHGYHLDSGVVGTKFLAIPLELVATRHLFFGFLPVPSIEAHLFRCKHRNCHNSGTDSSWDCLSGCDSIAATFGPRNERCSLECIGTSMAGVHLLLQAVVASMDLHRDIAWWNCGQSYWL